MNNRLLRPFASAADLLSGLASGAYWLVETYWNSWHWRD